MFRLQPWWRVSFTVTDQVLLFSLYVRLRARWWPAMISWVRQGTDYLHDFVVVLNVSRGNATKIQSSVMKENHVQS